MATTTIKTDEGQLNSPFLGANTPPFSKTLNPKLGSASRAAGSTEKPATVVVRHNS